MENGLLALMPTFIWWCLLVWGPIWLCQPSLLKRPSRRYEILSISNLVFLPFSSAGFPEKMHSWVEKKIFLLLSDSSAFARFCVPIRSPFRSKANCLEMHLKWPHLPLLSKDSKTTTFSSFSSLLEKRKRRKFHWKSLQNRIPQCAKMCTKASRETQLPQCSLITVFEKSLKMSPFSILTTKNKMLFCYNLLEIL